MDMRAYAMNDDDAAAAAASSIISVFPPLFTVHVPSPPCRLIGVVETPVVPSALAVSSSLPAAAAAAAAAGATLVSDGSFPWMPIGSINTTSSSSSSRSGSGVITLLHVTLHCFQPYAPTATFQYAPPLLSCNQHPLSSSSLFYFCQVYDVNFHAAASLVAPCCAQAARHSLACAVFEQQQQRWRH